MKKGIDKSKLMWYNVQVVRKTNAGMAQSVEHVIGNDEVISSILITSSKKALAFASAFFVLFAFYYLRHLLAHDASVIVVNEAEAVTVVGS